MNDIQVDDLNVHLSPTSFDASAKGIRLPVQVIVIILVVSVLFFYFR